MIDVADFHKAYDGLVAVAGLSFRVAPGEVLGLVGPNGAGKTTTLRALSGIVRASRGRLQVAGYDVDRQPLEAKSNLAYVPDDPQLFADLTVRQHLIFTASVYGVEDATGKAERLLDEFDIRPPDYENLAGNLSGGNQQKVIVAREFDQDPKLLIAAQPTRGVDVGSIEFIHQRLLQARDKGKAVLLISADLEEILSISDRIAVMYEGQIVGTLDPAEATEERLGLMMTGGGS